MVKLVSIIDLLALDTAEGAIAYEIERNGLFGYAPDRKRLRKVDRYSQEAITVLAGLSIWLNVRINGTSNKFEDWYSLEDPCAEFGWPADDVPNFNDSSSDYPDWLVAFHRLKDRYEVFKSPLITMGRLLMLRQAYPGDIATVIDSAGIHGEDEYGRVRFYGSESPQADVARSALRTFRASESSFDPHEIEPYLTRAINIYGFPPDKVPDFHYFAAQFEADQSAEQARHLAKQDVDESNAPLEIPTASYSENGKAAKSQAVMVAALLSFIRGEITPSRHPDFVNQGKLIELFELKFQKSLGLSTRNLKKRFAEANRIRDELDLSPLPEGGEQS